MYGADVVELRALGDKLARSADDLDRIAHLLTHQITSTTVWVGPGAQKFRGEWSGSHRGALSTSARALRECAAAARRNADEQDRTSAADSSTGSPYGAMRGTPTSGFELDQNAVAWIAATGLPLLRGSYDILGKMNSDIGLLKYFKKPEVLGRIPLLSYLTTSYDLAAMAPQAWDDIQSGNIWRFEKAVFNVGWTAAKIIPIVGLADAAANLGIDTGKFLMDGVLGQGASDRAFSEVGQQIDKAGNDLNAAGAAAGGWLADSLKTGANNILHFWANRKF
jgi:uncharacterized protein YukE